MTIADGFLEGAVRGATPLAFAALGELITERAGVINIGVEGSIAVGAFASFVVAGVAGPHLGLVAGGAAGAVLAVVFASFVTVFRAQQVIAGTAISILGLGLSATLHRAMLANGGLPQQVPTIVAAPIPFLSAIPVVGGAFFNQPYPTYLAYLLFPAASWLLFRTIVGLRIRAVGELPDAVSAAGQHPALLQGIAVTSGGFLAGVAGAVLVVAHAGTFSDGMSAGRGFIAIAIVALGRWRPAGVALGALLFGGASALQFVAQARGWHVQYNIALAAPYVLTLVAMTLVRRSRGGPARLGEPLPEPI